MILTVDIGNTNITLGVFDGDRLAASVRLSTILSGTRDEYASRLVSVFDLHGVRREDVDGAILSSVVPPLNAVLREAIRFVFGVDALTVGPGIKTGLNIHCDHPASVGSDLICACVAVHTLHGSPALIVDMGTATTITVVDKGNKYIGGAIVPGVALSMNALSAGTSLLQKVPIEAPKKCINTTAKESMQSGAVFGTAALMDGMIDRFETELGCKASLIATGGLAEKIVPHCNHEILYQEDLVLKGLAIIYHKNKR